MQSYNDGCAVS